MRIRSLKLKDSGFTTIEVMITAALLGFIAVALLPAIFNLLSGIKTTSFKAVCNAYVRAKLQEYVNGVSESSGALSYAPSGFEYSKVRYRQAVTASATNCQVNPTVGSPGFRESMNSNLIIADTAGPSTAGGEVPERMQGFQLYVMIRHYNPRVISGGQASRACPPSSYQFYRFGDALEVTVTGMIRTAPTVANGGRGGKKWGELSDLNATTPNPQLTCGASQVIYPPRVPFRYYLGNDGKLRSYQATSAFASGTPDSSIEAIEAHFRNIWSFVPSGGAIDSPTISNIRSITIAPDNNSVWVLKPGELILYPTCADESVTIGGKTFDGVPNCHRVTGVRKYDIDPNIENITVDFQQLTTPANDINEATPYYQDDKVYGLYNTGSVNADSIRMIELDHAGNRGRLVNVDSGFFALPTNRPRINGMFIYQTFPSEVDPFLYFMDNSCYSSPSSASMSYNNWIHCVSIFSSGDANMAYDVRELPKQVESISQ
ncbi:MAG: type II secretion system GspH family protein [Oligoflexia bacterium]|nr:type II secretion system GspH family protein [Oligoflexia bacterium]